jgi:hypothetical protein
MFKLDIRDVHFEMGESSTACCPIALAVVEKFLGTHPSASSVWKKNGIPLMRGDVVSVKTEHTRFWHPEKNKVYEFLHDEQIAQFIVDFDNWYESSADMKTLPLEETTLTFGKPWSIINSDKTLYQFFNSYNIPD